MFSEGLYGIEYKSGTAAPEEIGSGLVTLRAGKILGTDRCGSIFIGDCEYDTSRAASRIRVRMQVPPLSMLVNGIAAGEDGATIEIEAAIPDAAPTGTVDVAGLPVSVRLTYIGPLPN